MLSSCRRNLWMLLLVSLSLLSGCMGGLGSGLQDKSSAIVSVIASSSSVTVGQSVIMTAYVNPVLATGTVTFYNGSNAIGSAAISSTGLSSVGIALLATSFTSIGTQSITARYSGDDFFSANTSSAISVGVYSNQLAASSVTLQASTTTPQYLTNVALTAAVTPSTATGTVTFYNGSTKIGSAAVGAGAATLTTSFAAGGTATISAVYSGDYNYLSSTSNSLSMNISGPLVTVTTLSASTSSVAIGGGVTLTANLAPATATGSVTFYNGSTAIGSANVNAGIATLNTSFANSGHLALQAVFTANASWETSTSNQVALFVTGDTSAAVVLQVSPTMLVIGDSAELTANISPTTATGTVTFYDGTSAIGVSTVTGGIASVMNHFLSPGAQSLTAVYNGDLTFAANTSSAVALNVGNPGSTPTTTMLTLSEYYGYVEDSVTLIATVNPPVATGQVDFYDNGSFLQSVVLSSGTAAWSQVFLLSGDNNITATYDGDPTYAASTSSVSDLILSDYPDTPTTDPIIPTVPTDPTDPTDPGSIFGDAD